jgi:hypothetical protein
MEKGGISLGMAECGIGNPPGMRESGTYCRQGEIWSFRKKVPGGSFGKGLAAAIAARRVLESFFEGDGVSIFFRIGVALTEAFSRIKYCCKEGRNDLESWS